MATPLTEEKKTNLLFQELIEAVLNEDLPEVSLRIAAHPELARMKDADGNTPLLLAVREEGRAIAQHIIEDSLGPDFDETLLQLTHIDAEFLARDLYTEGSPANRLVEKKAEEILGKVESRRQLILTLLPYSDLNEANNDGQTPLTTILGYGLLETLKKALEQKPNEIDLNKKIGGQPATFSSGYSLLKKTKNPEWVNATNPTQLPKERRDSSHPHWKNRPAKHLNKDTLIDCEGLFRQALSVSLGRAVSEFLLQSGADIHAKDNSGHDLLTFLTRRGTSGSSLRAIRLLELFPDVNPNAVLTDTGESLALWYARQRQGYVWSPLWERVLAALVEKGAAHTTRDLMLQAIKDSYYRGPLVEALIKRDPDSLHKPLTDEGNERPIALAAFYNNGPFVALFEPFLTAEDVAHQDNLGQTLVFDLLKMTNIAVADRVIKKFRPDLSVLDNNGKSMADIAAINKHPSMALALLRMGCPVATGTDGKNVFFHLLESSKNKNLTLLALELFGSETSYAATDKDGLSLAFYAAKLGEWKLTSTFLGKGAGKKDVLNLVAGELLETTSDKETFFAAHQQAICSRETPHREKMDAITNFFNETPQRRSLLSQLLKDASPEELEDVLRRSIERNDITDIKACLAAGATLKNNDLTTQAMRTCKDETVLYLLANGGDPRQEVSMYSSAERRNVKCNAIECMGSYSSRGAHVIQEILKRFPDIEINRPRSALDGSNSIEEKTPLLTTPRMKNGREIARILFEHGADPRLSAPFEFGPGPIIANGLHIAVRLGDSDLFNECVKKYPDIDANVFDLFKTCTMWPLQTDCVPAITALPQFREQLEKGTVSMDRVLGLAYGTVGMDGVTRNDFYNPFVLAFAKRPDFHKINVDNETLAYMLRAAVIEGDANAAVQLAKHPLLTLAEDEESLQAFFFDLPDKKFLKPFAPSDRREILNGLFIANAIKRKDYDSPYREAYLDWLYADAIYFEHALNTFDASDLPSALYILAEAPSRPNLSTDDKVCRFLDKYGEQLNWKEDFVNPSFSVLEVFIRKGLIQSLEQVLSNPDIDINAPLETGDTPAMEAIALYKIREAERIEREKREAVFSDPEEPPEKTAKVALDDITAGLIRIAQDPRFDLDAKNEEGKTLLDILQEDPERFSALHERLTKRGPNKPKPSVRQGCSMLSAPFVNIRSL